MQIHNLANDLTTWQLPYMENHQTLNVKCNVLCLKHCLTSWQLHTESQALDVFPNSHALRAGDFEKTTHQRLTGASEAGEIYQQA